MADPERVCAGPAAVFASVCAKVGVLAGVIRAAVGDLAGRTGLSDAVTAVRAHRRGPAAGFVRVDEVGI